MRGAVVLLFMAVAAGAADTPTAAPGSGSGSDNDTDASGSSAGANSTGSAGAGAGSAVGSAAAGSSNSSSAASEASASAASDAGSAAAGSASDAGSAASASDAGSAASSAGSAASAASGSGSFTGVQGWEDYHTWWLVALFLGLCCAFCCLRVYQLHKEDRFHFNLRHGVTDAAKLVKEDLTHAAHLAEDAAKMAHLPKHSPSSPRSSDPMARSTIGSPRRGERLGAGRGRQGAPSSPGAYSTVDLISLPPGSPGHRHTWAPGGRGFDVSSGSGLSLAPPHRSMRRPRHLSDSAGYEVPGRGRGNLIETVDPLDRSTASAMVSSPRYAPVQ
eukprot:TRINITY_DN26489_c0_g1_i1.p1 TRINITY_DN26489_c0_g1~~TRINITY_DN26489_c0_g1_i1.p1  ORF type:complete len:345 (+),score=39.19 TRINITY_DN26489_c0_g1_i1:45-1037(+)